MKEFEALPAHTTTNRRIQGYASKEHLTRGILTILIGVLSVALASCSSDVEAPQFPDIEERIDAARAISLGNIAPAFGTQLNSASGQYYLSDASAPEVQRWYEQLVAEQRITYISETRDSDILHRLYETISPRTNFEVVVKPLAQQNSLVAIYENIERREANSEGSWLRRVWGFVLGRTERSASDLLFDFLTSILGPMTGFYEKLWLEPVINSLLALRWLLRWNYGLIIVFFALCLMPITGLFSKGVSKVTGRSKAGLIVGSVIIFIITGVFLGTAIWQALNGFYATAPSGQAWLQERIYPFWSQNIRNLASVPPGGSFLGMQLSQTNLLVVPLAVVIASIMIKALDLWSKDIYVKAMKRHGFEQRAEVAGFVSIAEGELKEYEEDPGAGLNHVFAAARAGAILAFVPVGVAIYFVAEKVIHALTAVLVAWQIHSMQDQPPARWKSHPAKSVKVVLRVAVMGALLVWLIVIDQKQLFRLDSSSRIAGLFAEPVYQAIAVVAGSSDPFQVTTVAVPQTAAEPVLPEPTEQITAASASSPTPRVGTVTANRLNLRNGPGTDTDILEVLLSGTEVVLLARNQTGDWLQVEIGGQTGWVAAEYLKTDVSIADLAVIQ